MMAVVTIQVQRLRTVSAALVVVVLQRLLGTVLTLAVLLVVHGQVWQVTSSSSGRSEGSRLSAVGRQEIQHAQGEPRKASSKVGIEIPRERIEHRIRTGQKVSVAIRSGSNTASAHHHVKVFHLLALMVRVSIAVILVVVIVATVVVVAVVVGSIGVIALVRTHLQQLYRRPTYAILSQLLQF